MVNVQMTLKKEVNDHIRNWFNNGSPRQLTGAFWLVAALESIKKTGQIMGDNLVSKAPVRVWHIHHSPCNLLYRDRKKSILDMRITIDKAVDGKHNWRKLGASLLSAPNGP